MTDAFRPSWLDRPSLQETQNQKSEGPILKGASRLERKVEAKKLTTVTDAQFRAIVWDRDKGKCRRCGRNVKKTRERDPLRGEVHHIHGRIGKLRHEDRTSLLLCASCHEKVTGRVNEKLVIIASKLVEIDGSLLTDARAKVRFERVA